MPLMSGANGIDAAVDGNTPKGVRVISVRTKFVDWDELANP